ncbi:MAG: hypothetical protein M3436_20935 [Pseudomonadota bacterium]|nr:hypothetical protein [Pseudomonadota bacterium]
MNKSKDWIQFSIQDATGLPGGVSRWQLQKVHQVKLLKGDGLLGAILEMIVRIR